ncbi:ADP/ATP-dependent (S)-NAD(P)H-hydrate dehydratase [Microbacterium sp. CFBP9034]|uniref:ADP-dependent NAD(P)H-hydrate dehydratase n=1 Tax=Microbacterium sp. CFBP9034 TaxID=3096540 RepID=UPI002A6B0BB5|nr:ADP/ATP-dependent (S)-NAD(P)H-hydrate dehydratase [Microbacterium sp. CFBP9034]MDY0909071.1 ADP/ATP-dependent (S)-NAD(P)H-hydrate dehydratase [Microbacterium sp. CFBP9034]
MTRSWTVEDTGRALRRPTTADDKYSRGVLGVRTGSDAYPGAAVLGVEAAWRTGLGMVRYVGAERPTALVLARRPETVAGDGRVQAWLIGSGTDAPTRGAAETGALRGILHDTDPVIVDAGALDLAQDGTAPRILTPHAREHARLRAGLGLAPASGDSVAAAQGTADATGAVLLLKGATTVVAAPGSAAIEVSAGTPWLATAGTGDVLAGVIGALVASAVAHGQAADAASLASLAASGAWLHGHAGRLASAERGGGPITALDVAEALPRAVAEALDAV